MKTLIFFITLMFCVSELVVTKSFHLDRNDLVDLELEVEKDGNDLVDPELEAEKDGNDLVDPELEAEKDRNDLVDPELEAEKDFKLRWKSGDKVMWIKSDSSSHQDKNNSGNVIQQSSNEEEDIKQSVTFTGWSEKDSSLKTGSLSGSRKEPVELNSKNSPVSDGTDFDPLSVASLLMGLQPTNFSDTVLLDLSNFTGDEIVLETLLENSSMESFDFDETSVMSEGGEIAFVQEMPSSGFEFLIDSHTKNILLTELLSSESVLVIDEDDDLSTVEGDEHSILGTVNFNLNNDGASEFQGFSKDNEPIPVNIKSEVNEVDGEEFELDGNTLNSTDIQLNDNTEKIIPECPEPGWCIFWFLSQDTCAENTHCLGSRICCKTGCSKTCIHV